VPLQQQPQLPNRLVGWRLPSLVLSASVICTARALGRRLHIAARLHEVHGGPCLAHEGEHLTVLAMPNAVLMPVRRGLAVIDVSACK